MATTSSADTGQNVRKQNAHIVTPPLPVRWSLVEAPTARFDSQGCQVDGCLRPRVEGAGRSILFEQPAAQLNPIERERVTWGSQRSL
eukprot:scaffold17028_cov31-Phaeocystis_antarctica.AAC.2